MIHIIHDPKDGYLLSHNKEIIKEQLQLKEFIERLVRVEDFQNGFSEIQSKVERDLYTIAEAFTSRNSEKVKAIADWLDHRYSNLIRNEKLTLMQHNYSVNIAHVEHRETINNTERTISQNWNTNKVIKEIDRQGYVIQESIVEKISKKKGITDDEVYYLTIP